MFSQKFKKDYYKKIQNLLKKGITPTKEQVVNILKKNLFELEDIYTLLQASGNFELEKLINKESVSRRKQRWENKLFLVPPLYVTDRCINDCLYCPWRRSNPIQRRSLNTEELKQELNFLIKQGYRTIELVGASDPKFVPKKIAEFISTTKHQLDNVGGGEIGLNFESASEEAYKMFVKSGLDFMVLWQETYHPGTYKKIHPHNTRKSDMDYRLDSFDRAINAGLKKVSLAFLGGLYNWKFEVLALFSHAKYIKETYNIDPFIVGTPRWKEADGQIFTEKNRMTDDNWKFVASIYKLVLPNTLPWFSTRENFELSKKVIQGGGALFTLDCSTAVGGYTLSDKFSQFPVYSKGLSKGIKWLKSLGYNPEIHLPETQQKYVFDDKKDMEIFLSVEKVLNENQFPIMSQIEKEEIRFLKNNLIKGSNFIEIGCGGGRILKKLNKNKFRIYGTEINKLFIKYCKNNKLNVFYLDAFKNVPKKYKETFDVVFLAYNTFYNFSKEKRLKVINHCKNLLKNGGKIILTVFAKTRILKQDKAQMMDYYKTVIDAPSEFEVRFIKTNNEKGFEMVHENKTLWFSKWKTQEEIKKEFIQYKGLKIKKIELSKNKRAYFIILEKK